MRLYTLFSVDRTRRWRQNEALDFFFFGSLSERRAWGYDKKERSDRWSRGPGHTILISPQTTVRTLDEMRLSVGNGNSLEAL